MKKLAVALMVLAVVLVPNVAVAAAWTSGVAFTSQVASTLWVPEIRVVGAELRVRRGSHRAAMIGA